MRPLAFLLVLFPWAMASSAVELARQAAEAWLAGKLSPSLEEVLRASPEEAPKLLERYALFPPPPRGLSLNLDSPRAPARFLGLVLADTRAGADTEEGRKNRYALRERVLAEGVGFLPEALLPNHLGKTTQEEKPEVVARAKALILEASPEAVAGSLLALAERPDSTPLLPGMRRPALVLVGEEDTLTPPEEAKRMAKALPDARLLILPEAGHLANLENPKAFRTALLGFLAEVL